MDISRRKFVLGSLTSFAGAGAVSEFLTPTVAESKVDQEEKSLQIIGHRGFSDKYPDNSLEGFKAAYVAGADGVEVDVRKTKDGKLVVSHDWFAFDPREGFKLIKSIDWAELQDIEPKIPSFDEFLDFVEDKELDVYIELKENIADEVRATVEQKELEGDVKFLAFESEWLTEVKDDYETGLIGTVPSEWLLKRATRNGMDMALPHFTSTSSMKEFFRSAEDLEIDSGYWAISGDKSDIQLGVESNPEILITNNPETAVQMIRE